MAWEIAIACVAALAAGFVDAIAGGGGVITFPTLLLLNLPVSLVVGTNKLCNSFGTLAAALTFYRSGKLNSEILVRALPFTCIGSVIGAYLVLQIPNDFLRPVASILVLALAIYLAVRPSLGQSDNYSGLTDSSKRLLVVSALVLGFYDGFLGPGTGMFLAYVMVRWIGLDFVKAAGNTKVLNLASNLVPLAYFVSQGNIRYDLGIPMALANILGGYLGAHSAIKAGPKLVRTICIVMSTILAGKLAWDYLG